MYPWINDSWVSIIGNFIKGKSADGICTGNLLGAITGNTLLNNGQAANATYSEINLDGNCSLAITGNYIYDDASNKCLYGVLETSNAGASTITGNIITGQTSDKVHLAGGSTSIIRSNIGVADN